MALNSIIPCLSDGVNASLAQLPAEVLKSITELRIRKKSAFGYSIRQSGVLYNRAREIDESYFGICLHGE